MSAPILKPWTRPHSIEEFRHELVYLALGIGRYVWLGVKSRLSKANAPEKEHSLMNEKREGDEEGLDDEGFHRCWWNQEEWRNRAFRVDTWVDPAFYATVFVSVVLIVLSVMSSVRFYGDGSTATRVIKHVGAEMVVMQRSEMLPVTNKLEVEWLQSQDTIPIPLEALEALDPAPLDLDFFGSAPQDLTLPELAEAMRLAAQMVKPGPTPLISAPDIGVRVDAAWAQQEAWIEEPEGMVASLLSWVKAEPCSGLMLNPRPVAATVVGGALGEAKPLSTAMMPQLFAGDRDDGFTRVDGALGGQAAVLLSYYGADEPVLRQCSMLAGEPARVAEAMWPQK